MAWVFLDKKIEDVFSSIRQQKEPHAFAGRTTVSDLVYRHFGASHIQAGKERRHFGEGEPQQEHEKMFVRAMLYRL